MYLALIKYSYKYQKLNKHFSKKKLKIQNSTAADNITNSVLKKVCATGRAAPQNISAKLIKRLYGRKLVSWDMLLLFVILSNTMVLLFALKKRVHASFLKLSKTNTRSLLCYTIPALDYWAATEETDPICKYYLKPGLYKLLAYNSQAF